MQKGLLFLWLGGSTVGNHTSLTFPLLIVARISMIEMMMMRDVKQQLPGTEQMVRQSTCCRRSTMHHKRNQRDATDRKSPKPRRRNVAKRTLSKNRTQVQRRRKAKPRLRKNCGQRSSCRTADSCVNLNKSYLSMYHKLFFLCEKHFHSEHVFI